MRINTWMLHGASDSVRLPIGLMNLVNSMMMCKGQVAFYCADSDLMMTNGNNYETRKPISM